MTLTLRPPGRGNWTLLTVVITGTRAAPLLFRKGHRFPIAGVNYRIVEVKA
jgi:hypothetical protein